MLIFTDNEKESEIHRITFFVTLLTTFRFRYKHKKDFVLRRYKKTLSYFEIHAD